DLGFDDGRQAIGEFIRSGENQWEIVGVSENYHHYSLKDKLIPLAFFKSLRWRASVGYYSFKLNAKNQETLQNIDSVWRRVYPGENFIYRFLDESYQDQYQSEQSMAISFLIAALLALTASCLGLLGLSRFNILKRTKEIGIRKAFGSSSALVMRLLLKETLIMVLISSTVGIPLSIWISKSWIENFSYRIDLSWWIFLITCIIVLLVAILSTLIQTWRASIKNPVEALRFE
ncbi:ABC transporter permease, partial [Bacteroidota bacterium]